MKVIKGGITAAPGFKANGIWCGIKRSEKLDLGLVCSDVPVPTAAVFTISSVKAAPVIICQKKVAKGLSQAMIVNSGNANCFTGEMGMAYAKASTKLVADLMNIKDADVLVASTGIIGKQMPYKKIEEGVPVLVKGLSESGGLKFAKSIMTTDTRVKQCAVQVVIDGKTITVGGCGKGSGMIEPNMATMLGFLTTDAAIDAKTLKTLLKKVAEHSFNCITVDGCMSTNDMVSVMANGRAGNAPIKGEGKAFDILYEAVLYVCTDLAKKIVLDGEGATKFITVHVKGATSFKQAKMVAMKVANSPLVKTAAFGCNPNWGRVAAAVGACGTKATEKELEIEFSSFKKKNISITVNLNLGKDEAVVYTSDLSFEYVDINGKYN